MTSYSSTPSLISYKNIDGDGLYPSSKLSSILRSPDLVGVLDLSLFFFESLDDTAEDLLISLSVTNIYCKYNKIIYEELIGTINHYLVY